MPNWGLGVDLGTSFSAGGYATSDRTEVLEIGRERRIPSTIVLDESGRLIAGTLAQRMVGRAPERAERNPKRYLGRGPMLLGGTPIEARDAMAALLELFVNEGRTRFDGAMPSVAVLTHPVAWSGQQREVLRSAASTVLATVPVTLVEEPVAAAVHYAATHTLASQGKVAVYDLGGGTFDSAVLAAGDGTFDVIGAPGGDSDIGGEVFDERIFEHFGAQLAKRSPEWWNHVTTSPERRWLASAADLLLEARSAKETLSEYETASQYVSGADADVEITRAELEDMIGADVLRTADILDETIRRAGVPVNELIGIFMTGGASRMPLVQQTLRRRHEDLVRTWDDPKIVVALGAARMALAQAKPRTAPTVGPVRADQVPPRADQVPPRADQVPPRADQVPPRATPTAPGGFEVRLEEVIDARATANGVYAYGVAPSGTGHLLHRVDRATAAPDRCLSMRSIVDWAPADSGLLVADRVGSVVQFHTLTPELVIRSTRPVGAPGRDPQLVATGNHGWAFFPTKSPQLVTNANGLPWGQVGAVSVMGFDLTTNAFVQNAVQVPLGQDCRWYVNEDNTQRRLLDQESPTTSHMAPSGYVENCIAILGQFTSKAPLGGWLGVGAHKNVTPWQMVYTVEPSGRFKILERRGGDWLYQTLCHDGRWLRSTTTGLEIAGPDGPTVLAPRPRAGALRWVPAGDQMYALGMDQTLPSSGVWIAVLSEGRLRTLTHEPRMTLLGHLTSEYRQERPRVLADGDTLWIGVGGDDGRSRILHVTPDGVTPRHSGPGWLEPVARIPTGLLCLSAPDVAPAPGRWVPARLVRLPS